MSFVRRNSCGVPVECGLACETIEHRCRRRRHTSRHLVEALEDVALVGCPGVVVRAGSQHFADAMFGEVLVMCQLGEVVEAPPLRLGVI